MATGKERYRTYTFDGNTYLVRFIPTTDEASACYVLYDNGENGTAEPPKELGILHKVRGGYEGYLFTGPHAKESSPVKCRSIKDLVWWLNEYRGKNKGYTSSEAPEA